MIHTCKNIFWSIKKIWEYNPKYVFLAGMQSGVTGFVPVLTLKLTQTVINLIQAQDHTFEVCLKWCLILVILQLVGNFATRFFAIKINNFETRYDTFVQTEILKKACRLDAKTFEDSNTYDVISRSQNDAHNGLENNMQGLIVVLSSLMGLISFGLILGTYNWKILCCVLLTYVVRFLFERKYNIEEYKNLIENTGNLRKSSYYSWLILHPEYNKELKIFNMFPILLKRFQGLRKLYDDRQISIQNKRLIVYYGLEVLEGIIDIMVTIFLIKQTFLGTIMIGSFVLYTNSISELKDNLLSLFDKIAGLCTNSAIVDKIKYFFELDDENMHVGEQHISAINSIELKNVSYKNWNL